MFDRLRARAEELQARGLEPLDAIIISSVELGDSAEQIAKRLGITRQAGCTPPSIVAKAYSRLAHERQHA